jgi:hypothetical protein
MNKVINILLATVLICLASSYVSAHDSQILFAQIERESQARLSKWKISRKLILPKSRHVSIRWKSGKAYVQMLVKTLDSAKEAADMFEGWDAEVSEDKIPGASEYSKVALANLGDKNYLWSHRKGGGSIRLRKGNTFVMLVAPSVDVAESFARLVADQLPAT